jgi:hypothetical protein
LDAQTVVCARMIRSTATVRENDPSRAGAAKYI